MIKIILHDKNHWLEASGYSLQDEARIYDENLQDILDNTRWYLENFEKLKTYRVRWSNYRLKGATTPYKFISKQKPL